MINLLSLSNIKNQTIYKVWMPTKNSYESIYFEKFTDCNFSEYSLTEPDKYNMVNFRCEIKGLNEQGKRVNVCGFDGRIKNNSDDAIKPIFFLDIDEALNEKKRLLQIIKEHKEKVISDATKDIQNLIEEGKMLRPCNLCLRENNEHSELKLKLTVI